MLTMRHVVQNEPGIVEMTSVEGAAWIRLTGECDVYTAPALRDHIHALLDGGATRIIFDLERVSFLDSSILGIFLTAHRRVALEGGEVILLCRPGFIRRLLSLLEMDRLMKVQTPEEWREETAAIN